MSQKHFLLTIKNSFTKEQRVSLDNFMTLDEFKLDKWHNPMLSKNPVCFWIHLKDEKQVTETLLWCPFCFHWLIKYGMLQSVAQRIDSSHCSDELNIYWCIIPHHNLDNRAVCVCERRKKKRLVTIAKPTSAFLRAGPSLVPSPVTATTCRVSPTVLSIMPDEEHKLIMNSLNDSTNEWVHSKNKTKNLVIHQATKVEKIIAAVCERLVVY